MEEADFSSWLGKPPPKPIVDENITNHAEANEKALESEPSDHESVNEISLEKSHPERHDGDEADTSILHFSPNGRDHSTRTSPGPRQKFHIEIPKLSEDQLEEYEFLPGHFNVLHIISEFKKDQYLVELESGETDLISLQQLRKLENGLSAINDYTKKPMDPKRRRIGDKSQAPGMIDWQMVHLSSSDESSTHRNTRQARSARLKDSNSSSEERPVEQPSSSSDEHESQPSERGVRRSLRLNVSKTDRHSMRNITDVSDDSDPAPRRRGPRTRSSFSTRPHPSTRSQRSVRAGLAEDSNDDDFAPTRRSERTKTRPRRSMRERQEDEISAHSEEEIGPRVVGTKEHFSRVHESDPFRRRHRLDCDTCSYKGDNGQKGPLVFCQGCTTSYHKSCLGNRGTREHLVTKVGENNFVLQCRRCLGRARIKDPLAPHQGVCSGCNKDGALSKPLRERLTTRQEQLQREENGGRDPVTIVDPSLIGNIANVMFRCATCQRAWHMHHLPKRNTAETQAMDESDDDTGETQLAQKRFDYYRHSWICKDCVENQSLIDTLVAWRPADLDNYIPGCTVDKMEESEKEYLVKWKSQSYFRTTWMPGGWVWGSAVGPMRVAFMKRMENQFPRMTTKDAIPEDFFRVDIVFDVRYSSVVRNSIKEIDLARVKEVDSAFVKYKGLAYEDAIWEKPPKFDDTERWVDFKSAYEDFVMKKHVFIPPQTTLRRHLAAIRTQDFESTLIKKAQPSSLTGGQMMEYQLEGLNWLYYQWFTGRNAILADEMGLGKTIQLIAFFATLVQDHKCWPFLVVVPNSTCPNWRREIKKWAPSLRVVTYYGSAIAKKLAQDFELFPKDTDEGEKKTGKHKRAEVKDIRAHIILTSYEAVTDDKTRLSLMRVPWQGLVVDEGQRLKNDKNLVYDALSKFRFPFKVLLTGTPLQNNARELFNLLQFLDRNINAASLEAKYENLTEENLPELHELLRPFFLRRTKVQVLTFLPPVAQIILPVTMSTVQKKLYKSILAKNPQLMRAIFSRDGPVASKERYNLNNILMQLRKTLCHPFIYSREIEERTHEPAVSHRNLVEASSKLQLLHIMLPKLQERGHRVLIFSQFLNNLDIVEDFLDGLGMQHRRLDGSINAMEKQKRIDDFNSPTSPYFAFLLSTRSGGVGINLATADTVIIMDPDFNPHQDIQALSRAHRIGQKKKVLVFQLMTRGSVEEKIMQIGKKKMVLDHVLIQQMDQEDDAGMDLESILRHGAEALFDDDNSGDIVYDSASVDKLLDRSQIENTSTGDDKSAESQFSFARIWQNDKAALEDGLMESGTTTPKSNPGIWDKILQEREQAYAEEAARKAEAFGRGKRKRDTVVYAQDGGAGDILTSPFKGQIGEDANDTDFQALPVESDENETDSQAEESEEVGKDQVKRPRRPTVPTVKARPFKRVRVPTGAAPHFDGDGASDGVPMGGLPPPHFCSMCEEVHAMGWCRLKIAGVEHCGLCGLAHLGHGRTCPHLNSEAQVATLLGTLKESTESRELVEQATKYLRMIRGDLVQRKRARERKQQETAATGGYSSFRVQSTDEH